MTGSYSDPTPLATRRVLAAGRVPSRRPGTETPLASAERLARFVRGMDGPNASRIYAELIAWRDREGLALGDDLIAHVAAYVANEPRERAA